MVRVEQSLEKNTFDLMEVDAVESWKLIIFQILFQLLLLDTVECAGRDRNFFNVEVDFCIACSVPKINNSLNLFTWSGICETIS
jgi:hypothetical protein